MNENTLNNELILSGSLNRGLFKLAIPAIVSLVSIMLFEIIDLFWMGRLGADAVAALGAASFVVWTVKSLANCVAAGINALVARVAGSRNIDSVQLWSSQGMLLTSLFSVVITIPLLLINHRIFALIGLAPDVARMAEEYTLITSLGIIFIYNGFTLDTIFRSLGNTFIPMIVILFALALNAVLDPLFIFGWLGFPKMGMPGGALATIISHTAGMVLLFLFLPKIRLRLVANLQNFWRNSFEIFRIGIPIGVLGAVFSIIYLILSKNIAYFGTVPMAAITAGHRIESLPFFIAFGFSTAVSTFVGQNLGNRNAARAEKAVHLALLYAMLFMATMSLLFIFQGRFLLSIFVPDPAVIETGYRYLFAISMFEIFLAPEVILEGAFTGAGDTKPPFFISIPLTFIRIPLAYYFSISLGFGVTAIWWVIGVSTLLKGITMIFWFQLGRWKTREIGVVN
jgi:putative MATE family efflux protein